MSTPASETFAASLADLDVGLTTTTAADATAVLAELAEAPTVGVPLDIEGVNLPSGVTTEVNRETVGRAATGITPAAYAIADYGSVVITSDPRGDEPVSLYADTHVAVVAESDVLADMPAAFERLSEDIPADRRSRIVATGPSATADMGELVRGAHGPQAVEVVVVSDR